MSASEAPGGGPADRNASDAEQRSSFFHKSRCSAWSSGTGLALGVAIGAGIGVALGQLAIGIGAGVALGAALDAWQSRRERK